jgi:uncharacterized membrane protein
VALLLEEALGIVQSTLKMTRSENKTLAIACWVVSLVPFLGIIMSIVLLVIYKDRFVRANAAQCLIMLIVWDLVIGVIASLTFGIGRVLFIIPRVLAILGAVKAAAGETFVPPFTGPIAKAVVSA